MDLVETAFAREARTHAPVKPPRRRRVVLWLGVLVVAGTLLFALDELLQPDAFPVEHVRFEGEFKHVQLPELERAVLSHARGNFFTLDLARVETAARAVPWVHRVSVRREWPPALHVRYTEQRLVAHWGKAAWINSSGEVVELADARPEGELPRLDGPAGTHAQVLGAYRKWGALLAPAGLQIRELALAPRRAWTMRVAGVDGGAQAAPTRTGSEGLTAVARTTAASAGATDMVLLLGRDELHARVARFAEVYTGSLLPKAVWIRQVDLRYPNGFAVTWKGSQATS